MKAFAPSGFKKNKKDGSCVVLLSLDPTTTFALELFAKESNVTIPKLCEDIIHAELLLCAEERMKELKEQGHAI